MYASIITIHYKSYIITEGHYYILVNNNFEYLYFLHFAGIYYYKLALNNMAERKNLPLNKRELYLLDDEEKDLLIDEIHIDRHIRPLLFPKMCQKTI